MAKPPAYRSPCLNLPLTGKDKPADPTLIEGSDTYTLTSAVLHALTPIPAFISAPSFAFAPVNANATVRYSKADFQPIFRTVLEAKPFAPAPAPQPLVFPDGPCKRPLKARFPKLYCGKTHIECYNVIQQCKDYFATAGAKRPNRVLFAATFLWEQALFRW